MSNQPTRAELIDTYRAKARESQGSKLKKPVPVWDDDLIPSTGDKAYVHDDIDTLLDSVGIVQAYRLWCGKMEPIEGSRTESVMVSCPIPGHQDDNPSAWLNTDKDVWHCGACSEGGDKFDIAAYSNDYNVPGYKTDGSFPDLRRDMAYDLGYRVTPAIGTADIVTPLTEDESDDEDPEPAEPIFAGDKAPAPNLQVVQVPDTDKLASATADASIIEIPTDYNAEIEIAPSIEWPDIVTEGTFLREWMETCSVDDLPEEYYFWLGLMALGLATGHDVVLDDRMPVKANLFVCLFGPSGIGKSRATYPFRRLLSEALPYDAVDPYSTGVHQMAQPGSAEGLLESFSKPIVDPMTNVPSGQYAIVRGLLNIAELSSLMGRAARTGSTLRPLMIELYDANSSIQEVTVGRGVRKAEKPFCSTITTTQPKVVRDVLAKGDAESGFANRWIFAMGPPKKLVAIGGASIDVSESARLLIQIRTWTSQKRAIRMDDEALAVWTKFFDRTLVPLKMDAESSGLVARCDLTMKKAILLFAINEKASVVTKDIVERALTLWPYLAKTYSMLDSSLGTGEFDECAEAILASIARLHRSTKKWPTVYQISRAVPRRFGRDVVERVIKTMAAINEISVAPDVSGKRGRNAVRYKPATDSDPATAYK